MSLFLPCIEISLGSYVHTYNSVMREIYADEELAEKLDNAEMSEDAAISYLGMKLFILEQTIPEDSTEFEQTAIVTATNQALILYLIHRFAIVCDLAGGMHDGNQYNVYHLYSACMHGKVVFDGKSNQTAL